MRRLRGAALPTLILIATLGAGSVPSAAADCTPQTLDACRYGPTPGHRFASAPEEIVELDYADATGAVRRFSIAVRRPLGATEPLPIVVWSHGGARGQDDASTAGVEWGRVFTGAGYLFVAIAHHERTMAERLPLCRTLGFDDQASLGSAEPACETFKFLSWDRPHDLKRVLDWIDQQAAGPLAGKIDPHRLLYAGHSAGAGATLMAAGASRDFAGAVRTLSDPRPAAFLGCSPQGVGHDGFEAGSFDAIDRPYLTLSGAGDNTEGHPATARRDAFDHMKPGHAYLGWIADPTTRHVTFNLEPAACVRGGGSEARCAQHLEWLTSAALAFADAHLRDAPEAKAYLASEKLRVLSGGTFELSHR